MGAPFKPSFGLSGIPRLFESESAYDDAGHREIQDLRRNDKVGRLLAAFAVKGRGLTESHNVFHLGGVDHVFQNALAKYMLIEALQNETTALGFGEVKGRYLGEHLLGVFRDLFAMRLAYLGSRKD